MDRARWSFYLAAYWSHRPLARAGPAGTFCTRRMREDFAVAAVPGTRSHQAEAPPPSPGARNRKGPAGRGKWRFHGDDAYARCSAAPAFQALVGTHGNAVKLQDLSPIDATRWNPRNYRLPGLPEWIIQAVHQLSPLPSTSAKLKDGYCVKRVYGVFDHLEDGCRSLVRLRPRCNKPGYSAK